MSRKTKADETYEKEFPYLTDKERFLVGWPGYRTRIDKSGLAYVESCAELGHMQGRMLAWLLTGNFVTRNPAYLFVMFFIGVIWSWPLIPIVSALFGGDYEYLYVLIVYLPYFFAGVLLLVSVAKCVFGEIERESITGD